MRKTVIVLTLLVFVAPAISKTATLETDSTQTVNIGGEEIQYELIGVNPDSDNPEKVDATLIDADGMTHTIVSWNAHQYDLNGYPYTQSTVNGEEIVLDSWSGAQTDSNEDDAATLAWGRDYFHCEDYQTSENEYKFCGEETKTIEAGGGEVELEFQYSSTTNEHEEIKTAVFLNSDYGTVTLVSPNAPQYDYTTSSLNGVQANVKQVRGALTDRNSDDAALIEIEEEETEFADLGFTTSISEQTVTMRSNTEATGGVDSFEWDVDGDGDYEETGRETSYTYESSGEKSITLRVTAGDSTKTVTKTVTIETENEETPSENGLELYSTSITDNKGENVMNERNVKVSPDSQAYQATASVSNNREENAEVIVEVKQNGGVLIEKSSNVWSNQGTTFNFEIPREEIQFSDGTATIVFQVAGTDMSETKVLELETPNYEGREIELDSKITVKQGDSLLFKNSQLNIGQLQDNPLLAVKTGNGKYGTVTFVEDREGRTANMRFQDGTHYIQGCSYNLDSGEAQIIVSETENINCEDQENEPEEGTFEVELDPLDYDNNQGIAIFALPINGEVPLSQLSDDCPIVGDQVFGYESGGTATSTLNGMRGYAAVTENTQSCTATVERSAVSGNLDLHLPDNEWVVASVPNEMNMNDLNLGQGCTFNGIDNTQMWEITNQGNQPLDQGTTLQPDGLYWIRAQGGSCQIEMDDEIFETPE